jgi:DNA-binding MarR family transcriptional regulator
MTMADENVVTGRLLWQVANRWRAAVDRAVAPLGLTHAQYVLLGSLSGLARTGVRPSQRELADYSGLDAIYVSKLIKSLEQSGLVARTEHPADPRALQLALSGRGEAVIREAVTIVHALQDELTAPIGGANGPRNRQLTGILQSLLNPSDRSKEMTEATIQPPALTGQDIAEAQGAVRGLLDQILRTTGTTSEEYVTLRVIAFRGPWADRAALAAYLATQPQLGLDADGIANMLARLVERDLITADGPITLTGAGTELHAGLTATVQRSTGQLYAGFDPGDLEVAHRVLKEITERAGRLQQNY